MKTWSVLLLLSALVFATCYSAAVSGYDEDKEDDASALTEDERIKRSGGGNVLGYIGNKITSGISSGISSSISGIASASSGLKSGLSKKDYGGHAGGGGHEYGGHAGGNDEHHEGKNLDGIWSFKKSIFQTLLQAVKAISGGVIGIGGKVTKGAGYAVEAKGRFLQSAGDSLYGYGKQVSQKALHPIIHHPPPVHSSYVSGPAHVPVATGYGAHSAIQAAPLVASFSSYGNTGPAYQEEYGAPHYQVARAAKPAAHSKTGNGDGVKSGLLVLKPINVQQHQQHQQPEYGSRSSNRLNHAESNNYQVLVQPPQAYSRSYMIQGPSYEPQLGYNFPNIEYEQ